MLNKKYVLLSLVSVVFIFLVLGTLFLLNKYPFQQENESLTQPKLSFFPIETDAGSNFAYSFECEVKDVQNTNIEYRFGDNKHDYVLFRSLASCSYLDSESNEKSIYVALGSVVESDEGFFIAYGDRSINFPIWPEFATGEKLNEMLENYFKEIHALDYDPKIGQGDTIRVTLIKGENTMAKINSEEYNGTSDYVYYGFGLTKSWEETSFDNFVNTGNPEYLPKTTDEKAFVPALRITYVKDEK